MSFINLPAYGAPTWRYTVSTVLALPALNNIIGDVRVTEDTSAIYVWSGAAWILSGGGGGGVITSINADATPAQILAVGTSGSDFALVNNGAGTHTFNLPTASASNRGALSSADWSTFNGKQSSLTIGNLTDVGTDGIVVTGGTGAIIGSGTSIAQHVSDTTHNGYLSSTDWNTFNGKQSALTLGNLTDVGTDGIVITGGTGAIVGSGTSIAQHVADTTHNGYLTSTDWNTFNGKQSTVTIGALDAQTVNGTGLALVSNVLSAQSADGTHPGMVNIAAQTFAGAKTFSSQIISTVSTGTAPFSVASTTQVANLNAATAGSATSATTATTATNVAGGAGGSIPYQSAAATTAMLANGSAGQRLVSAGGTSAPTWTTATSQFGITIDGGGSVLSTGLKGFITIPYACTITANYMMADVSGSCVIDVWRKAFASFPPTISDSITTGGTPPTLSSAQSSSDTTLSNWSVTCAANDVFAFNVNSATTVTRVTLTLKVSKL